MNTQPYQPSLDERYVAIVLCAGLGTRLAPLTSLLPKPALPLGQYPVAIYSLYQLLQAGFQKIHCNIHYQPEKIKEQLILAIEELGYPPSVLEFWYEDTLLETGGGVARIAQGIGAHHKDVLVCNGDIVAPIPLESMITTWEAATSCDNHHVGGLLCTRSLPAPRPDVTWLHKPTQTIQGFRDDIKAPSDEFEPRLFTTHQILSKNLVYSVNITPISSRDLFYRESLRRGLKLLNCNYPNAWPWFDIGSPSDYATAIQVLRDFEQTLPHQNCLSTQRLSSMPLPPSFEFFLKKNQKFYQLANLKSISSTTLPMQRIRIKKESALSSPLIQELRTRWSQGRNGEEFQERFWEGVMFYLALEEEIDKQPAAYLSFERLFQDSVAAHPYPLSLALSPSVFSALISYEPQ